MVVEGCPIPDAATKRGGDRAKKPQIMSVASIKPLPAKSTLEKWPNP